VWGPVGGELLALDHDNSFAAGRSLGAACRRIDTVASAPWLWGSLIASGQPYAPGVPFSPLPGSEPPDPNPLARSLDRIVRHLGGPSASAVSMLFDDWAAIVGPPLCDHTWPLTLTDRTLSVGVDDPAWASHLKFLERELCGQVNDRLGPGAVESVVFCVRLEGADERVTED